MKLPSDDDAMKIMMLGLGALCFAAAIGIIAMVIWSFTQ